MRIWKRFFKIAALVVLALVLLLIILLELPFLWASDHTDGLDYSHWMRETLTGNEKLTEVAMLGAHDALTADMQLFSTVDEASVASPFQLGICKSLGYRQSKTQLAGVADLLKGGVRYFDIRVTRDPATGEFYTVHNYYSAPLSGYLQAFTSFMAQHPGEVLVLDFQHCYDAAEADGLLGEAHREELYSLLSSSGLFAYAQTPDLTTATYGEVTNGGSRAACLLLIKNAAGHEEFLNYETSIYSPWFHTDSAQTVFQGLEETAAAVQDGLVGKDVFRVQQGVLTMQASPSGIFKAIASWSLLRRAEGFNAQLAARQNEAWLAAMPIVMIDHTLSTAGNAHAALMEAIVQYNRGLAEDALA